MTALALHGLWAHRARTLLTALAVVLGVGLVTATLVLTGAISRGFDSVFSDAYAGTDAVVVGRTAVGDSSAGRADLPPGLAARIAALPGVAAASGQVMDFTGSSDQVPLLRADGTPVDGDPRFGFGVDPSAPALNPFRLSEGRWPRGPGEVVLVGATADAAGARIGGTVGAVGVDGARRMHVVGIAGLGRLESLGGATIALFDVPTARALLGRTGPDLISVAARPGTTTADLMERIRPLLPRNATVRTGAEQADAERQALAAFVSFLRWFLLAFAAVSLVAGAIVIANAMSMTVAQRTRDLATLRTLGASRRQVLRLVMTEALVTGLAASAAGVAAGVALARGMAALFATLGMDMPRADMRLTAGVAVIGLATGTLVTLAAGLSPAIRASRVPPVAAVRAEAGPAGARGRRAEIAALATGLAGAAAIAAGLFRPGIASGTAGVLFGVGVVALLLGVAGLAPRLVRPLVAVAGWPSRRFGGVAGGMARDNAARDVRRTGATAASLMVGLALITFVATLGAGLRSADHTAVRSQLAADLVVSPDRGFGTMPRTAGRLAASAPGVATATAVRADTVRAAGSEVPISGVDPGAIASVYRFRWDGGARGPGALRPGTALVSRAFADAHGLAPGERFPLTTAAGVEHTARVTGIVDIPRLDPLLGDVVVDRAWFDRIVPRPSDGLVLVALLPGGDGAALRRAVGDVPGAVVLDRDAFVAEHAASLDGVMNILFVLLGVAVVVAALGLAGTQALAIHERRREIGTLRAIGMSRRQTRRMVRHESVITALIGAALGIPAGIAMAGLVCRAMPQWDVPLVVPPLALGVVVVVAVVAGVLSAARPARRAARLDVLEALAAE